MAGYFELVDAPDGGYRIRMMDGAGQLMAVSVTFPTKKAAVAGVAQAREIAGTGLIRDRSADGRAAVPGSSARVIRGRPAVPGRALGPLTCHRVGRRGSPRRRDGQSSGESNSGRPKNLLRVTVPLLPGHASRWPFLPGR